MAMSSTDEACDRTMLVAGCDLRPAIREQWGKRFNVADDHLYADYKEMLAKEQPDIGRSLLTLPMLVNS